jgi:aconitate hydratase
MSRFNAKSYLELNDGRKYSYYSLGALAEQESVNLDRLPFSIKVLLENLLRNYETQTRQIVEEGDVLNVANWQPSYETQQEIPYYPGRVVMQDFTGVPAVVDLAAMRDAVKDLGQDPKDINPAIPVDLVIDHSVQVDFSGSRDAARLNMAKEYSRNGERYELMKWAQGAFENLRIFPPGAGIIHQVNLEYISRVVATKEVDGETVAFPDTLIGTDSHTTMIDGLGIMGWGVGGIEAESVMLGQPYYMKIPQVVGVKLKGKLPTGATGTDLVLTITQILRKEKVVEKFVEFYGQGVKELTLPDRAMIANMAPEYGATMGFFPIDEQSITYLETTNRSELTELVERYTKAQGLWLDGDEEPEYSQVVEVDLSKVTPSLAGPSRPQDRINLEDMNTAFSDAMNILSDGNKKSVNIELDGQEETVSDGSVVVAAITSCTNTSNPAVLIGAGLLAKKAVEKGLKVNPVVKTSLAPGSRVVEVYLEKAGVLSALEELGFYVVGYGCTTCIGNTGPLRPEIENAIVDNKLVATSVLSGNRNFEARIHPKIRANYLGSPLLVVAFALAGRVDIDMTTEPIGTGSDGKPVFLKDIWPSADEIRELIRSSVTPDIFEDKYSDILEGDENWKGLDVAEGVTYKWNDSSTYIRRVPFLDGVKPQFNAPGDIEGARALLVLGDTVTTDHISPAGVIAEEYPAGQYLKSHNVEKKDFNTYGTRRGNHEVMMRGTFANVRIKNRLVAPKEGGLTMLFPEEIEKYVFDAAEEYKKDNVPLVVLGGKEYGTGSSRDWAAKGSQLLGVKAVIAESYERIHRSNLIGMGVLPLEFESGKSVDALGLTGSETFSLEGISSIEPGKELKVTATDQNGKKTEFKAVARLDTEVEVDYFKHSGILPYVLRDMIR